MDINSPEFANFLDKIIERKFESLFDESRLRQYGIMRGFPATVTSVSGSTASVTLAGDSTNIIPNLKNKTNQTLVAGDEVFLFTTSTLSNAFIGVCKNKP